MHSKAWHRQIWQPLKQNALDVHIRVEEDAVNVFAESDQDTRFAAARGAEASIVFCVWSSFLRPEPQWFLSLFTTLLYSSATKKSTKLLFCDLCLECFVFKLLHFY